MNVVRVPVGDLDTNCWVISDDSGGPAVVIDPGDDLDRVLDAVGGRPVEAIVLTHAHFDHVGAVTGLAERTSAPVLIHESDAARLTHASADGTGGALFGYEGHVVAGADRTLVDGDRIEAGRLALEVLHTPGHTQGGISLLAREGDQVPHLFTGDTLFAGSVGRTDFPGGDGRVLAHSIAEKLAPLDPGIPVHPGHGPDTSIGRETRINPFWPRA